MYPSQQNKSPLAGNEPGSAGRKYAPAGEGVEQAGGDRERGQVGRVERPGPGGVTYVIDDVACAVAGGSLRAGDDAADARWVGAAELATLPVTVGLLDALTRWGVLPPG